MRRGKEMAKNEENTSKEDGDSKNKIENLEDYFKSWLDQNNKNIQNYYDKTLLRARALFGLSIVTYVIVVFFFFADLIFLKKQVGVYFIYLKNSLQVDTKKCFPQIGMILQKHGIMWALIVPAIIGVVLVMIACMFFREYRQTLQELSVIYDRISANDKYALALKATDMIQGNAGQELYKEIAESALKDAHKLYEEINEKH